MHAPIQTADQRQLGTARQTSNIAVLLAVADAGGAAGACNRVQQGRATRVHVKVHRSNDINLVYLK